MTVYVDPLVRTDAGKGSGEEKGGKE